MKAPMTIQAAIRICTNARIKLGKSVASGTPTWVFGRGWAAGFGSEQGGGRGRGGQQQVFGSGKCVKYRGIRPQQRQRRFVQARRPP